MNGVGPLGQSNRAELEGSRNDYAPLRRKGIGTGLIARYGQCLVAHACTSSPRLASGAQSESTLLV